MQRISSIGLLRAVAATLVLISHVAFWSGGSKLDGVGRLAARGDAGVAIFFAISAYLLTRRACAHEVGPSLPLRAYWIRRLARILPAYWVALVAVLVFTATQPEGLGGAGKVIAHIFVVQGYTQNTYRGFTQTWSLTTELTFYALVPAINAALRSCRRSGTNPLPILGGLTVCGLVVQGLSASSGITAAGALSTSVLGHLAWFCAGIACAWLAPDGAGSLHMAKSPRPSAWFGAAGIVYLLAATGLGGPLVLTTPSLATAITKEFLYAVLAGVLLWGCLNVDEATQTSRADVTLNEPVSSPEGTAANPGRLSATSAAPLPRSWWHIVAERAGDVSYGLFCWHVLVIDILFSALGLHLFAAPFWSLLVVTILISGLLANLSFDIIERPVIAAAHRVTSPRNLSTNRPE